ncbi:MAG: hypothetical protein RM338_17350 [Nostoc sp. DedQUE12a]|nr:hypothetical protein [Nostoc sp. DedQUE12a]
MLINCDRESWIGHWAWGIVDESLIFNDECFMAAYEPLIFNDEPLIFNDEPLNSTLLPQCPMPNAQCPFKILRIINLIDKT